MKARRVDLGLGLSAKSLILHEVQRIMKYLKSIEYLKSIKFKI